MRKTMLTRGAAMLGAALLAGTGAARATELVIFNNWSSPSEVKALGVLKKGLEATGNTWKDITIPHDSGSNVTISNMIAGGNPPDVFIEANPAIYRDIKKQGLGFPITDLFTRTGALAAFPQVVRDSITVDGEVVKIPVGAQVDGMVFYNKAVADKLGIDPKSWKSMDDFFAVYDKIKAAGIIPLAIGGDQFQIGYLFHALVAATTGNALFDKLYGPKPDRAALDSPEMRTSLDMLRKFQQHTDPGSPNRKWNDTTNLVITGKALMQVHGDWMKGEFLAAGKKLGQDFECMTIPGAKGDVLTVDAYGLIDKHDDAKAAAQRAFASMVVDPKTQVAFSAFKGSTPVRLDIDQSGLDECNRIALGILRDPSLQHVTPHNTADADWENAIWEQVNKFWTDPAMSDDDAIKGLQDAYDNIF